MQPQPFLYRLLRSAFRTIVFAIISLAAAGTYLHATQVRPLNLEEMARSADRIFSGRCTRIEHRSEPRLGIDIVVATFRVERSVKGAVGKTLTVRMPAAFGSVAGHGPDDGGAAGFHEGDEVVLLLYGNSAYGLTSPVGLGQGKFAIKEDTKKGRRVAVNPFGNRGLLHGLSSDGLARISHVPRRSHDTGDAIDPADLLDMIQALRP